MQPGTYAAGPYLVEEAYAPRGTRRGYVIGPQLEAAAVRIGDGTTCTPVIGDMVLTTDVRTGHISSVMVSATGVPLYCLTFPRGRRLCLYRHEFQVALP